MDWSRALDTYDLVGKVGIEAHARTVFGVSKTQSGLAIPNLPEGDRKICENTEEDAGETGYGSGASNEVEFEN